MFLTSARILLKNSHPGISIQLAVGITCYMTVFSLLAIKFQPCIRIWTYLLLPVLAIDIGYFIYSVNNDSLVQTPMIEMHVAIDTNNCINLINSSSAENLHNPTLSSEVNDYRVSHYLSLSSDGISTMFSTSEEQDYE